MFDEAGYATACIGKWHLGFGEKAPCDWSKPLRPGPLELGFDYYFGVPKVNSGPPYVYVENDRVVGWDPADPLVFDRENPTPVREYPEKVKNYFGGAKRAHELYVDELVGTTLTGKAVGWIREHQDEPFFLYFATTNIHHPFTPAPRFRGTSECGLYGDFIHELDWIVGEVLRTLDELDLTRETIVIFTSDNGGMLNLGGREAWKKGHRLNGDLLGFKFGAWEGGHRVPMIVRWPGHVPPGNTSDALMCHVDLLATFAAILDQPRQDGEGRDSLNQLETITGRPLQPVRTRAVLAPSRPEHLAIRDGDWVYIGARGSGGFGNGLFRMIWEERRHSDIGPTNQIKPDAPPAQLYNLQEDPNQQTNVIRENPLVAERLRQQRDARLREATE
jgi:arylsulfatase A-like enzyme